MTVSEKVYYTRFLSPLGNMWAARTNKGILRLKITDSRCDFLNDIKKMGGEFIQESIRFKNLNTWLEGYFAGNSTTFKDPLDLRGTKFQVAIWKAIHNIPYGRLASYGALAEKIGNPKACRASGNAVGANPCVIIIPCHRVIHSNGGIGGFGYGLNMKRRLLNIEGILPNDKQSSEEQIDLRSFFQ